MTVILGLRSKHDSSAALLIDGELIAAAVEERFTRRKHFYGFPQNSIEYVLAEAGLKPSQVDLIARDGLSWNKTFKRLSRQLSVAWSPRLYRDVIMKGWNRYFRMKQDVKTSEESQLHKMGFA
jgi:predicted NodU family carbamoyl transferase